MKKVFFIFFVMIFIVGCSQNNGTYALISPQNISLFDVERPVVMVKKDADSKSHSSVLGTFIPLGRAPNIQRAMEDILKEYNGDYLTNVRLNFYSFKLMIYFDYRSWEITADVMKFVR